MAALARLESFDVIAGERQHDFPDALIERRIESQLLGFLNTLRFGAKWRFQGSGLF